MSKKFHIGKLVSVTNTTTCIKCGTKKNLTMDHIIPRSIGGARNHIANLQVMCRDCNHKKASKIYEPYEEYVLLERIISCGTKEAKWSKIYGTKILSAIVRSAVQYDMDSRSLLRKNDVPKLLEYANLYRVNLKHNIEYTKLPIKNAQKYVKEFNPNYEMSEEVLHSYFSKVIEYTS
jgi:hypothetical protein